MWFVHYHGREGVGADRLYVWLWMDLYFSKQTWNHRVNDSNLANDSVDTNERPGQEEGEHRRHLKHDRVLISLGKSTKHSPYVSL